MSTSVVTYSVGSDAPESVNEIPKYPELLRIPNIDKVESLKEGFIAFYGFKEINMGMREVRRHYLDTNKEIHRIALRIDTYNKSNDSRGTMENLSTQESLSLWRCDNHLKTKICSILGTVDIEYTLTNNIEMFDKLWNHKLFKYVKVFMWQGDFGVVRKIAAVRNREFVETMDVT